MTTALFLEYEAVLKRPEQRQAHGLTIDGVDSFLNEVAALAEPVEVHFRWRPQLPDAGDEMILEAAVNGRAEALVTYNIRDFGNGAARLGVRVVRPQDALTGVRS